jgi:hypothetical protein
VIPSQVPNLTACSSLLTTCIVERAEQAGRWVPDSVHPLHPTKPSAHFTPRRGLDRYSAIDTASWKPRRRRGTTACCGQRRVVVLLLVPSSARVGRNCPLVLLPKARHPQLQLNGRLFRAYGAYRLRGSRLYRSRPGAGRSIGERNERARSDAGALEEPRDALVPAAQNRARREESLRTTAATAFLRGTPHAQLILTGTPPSPHETFAHRARFCASLLFASTRSSRATPGCSASLMRSTAASWSFKNPFVNATRDIGCKRAIPARHVSRSLTSSTWLKMILFVVIDSAFLGTVALTSSSARRARAILQFGHAPSALPARTIRVHLQ